MPRLPTAFSLVTTGVTVIPGPAPNGADPFAYQIEIGFLDEGDRAFYRTSTPNTLEDEHEETFTTTREIKKLSLVLKQPVIGCLSKVRIRENLNASGLMRAFAPLPDDFEFSVTPFEESAIMRYRQALALGHLTAFIFDKDSRGTPIPPDFWRRDVARPLLTQSDPVSIEIDGEKIRGYVFVDRQRLCDDWFQAFSLLPMAGIMAGAELHVDGRPAPPFVTPWITFMQKMAHELSFVNGEPTRWNISTANVVSWIELKWDPGFGPYQASLAEAMAKFIANADVYKVGKPTKDILAHRALWKTFFEAEKALKINAQANV